MADKRAHLAQMNAVKLADALSDEETKALIEHQKGTSLMLVEVVHGPYTVGIDGTRTISLLPGTVVRVPDQHAGPIKNMLRALAAGSDQAITFDEPGDAYVPPVDEAAKAATATAEQVVKEADEAAAAAAADPEAPLPAGDAADGDEDGETDGPWPGDEGYEAPGTAGDEGGDDLAAQRAKSTRKAAGGQ